MTRWEAHRLLGGVRDELEAARFALSTLAATFEDHRASAPALTGRALSLADVRLSLGRLEITYIHRLFATYEAILRDFWLKGVGRPTEPDLKPLMDSIASRRRIDARTLADAHNLRRFRNILVHRNEQRPPFDFGQCLRVLNLYVRYLPERW